MISTISNEARFQKGAGLSGYVAELCPAFSCTSLGIVPTVRHADYIGSWLEVLHESNRAIVRAASQASKAANFILGFLPHEQTPPDTHVGATEARAA